MLYRTHVDEQQWMLLHHKNSVNYYIALQQQQQQKSDETHAIARASTGVFRTNQLIDTLHTPTSTTTAIGDVTSVTS